MEHQPLVSVVITTYNRKDSLEKAVASALRQTYASLEILVLDDASGDGTEAMMQELCKNHSNIFFIRNAKNIGFVNNLNKGVGLAKGSYIARLDDDDIWLDRQKIEKQVRFLENHTEYTVTGGGVVVIDKAGRETVKYLLPEKDEDIRRVLLTDNVFAHSAVVFRKEAFLKAGGYERQFGFFADWALWLELGKMGKFYNFPEFFIYYLDQEGNKASSSRDLQIRRKLLAKMALNKKYRNYYAGSNKALLLSLASYCYSFIPFRKKLWPLIFRIRKLFFGLPPYTYFGHHEI